MSMFYVKNVPGWERAARVLAGAAMAAAGLWVMPAGMMGWGLVAGGVGTALTGFIGFCPMCAMVGRRLEAPK